MDIDSQLTEHEQKFLSRAARRRSVFLVSSIATVLVAVTILVYHGLIMKDMNGSRFVIILLLLLSGRSYLRLYKSATIFSKLKTEPATGEGRD
jgi:hypothetical protein